MYFTGAVYLLEAIIYQFYVTIACFLKGYFLQEAGVMNPLWLNL